MDSRKCFAISTNVGGRGGLGPPVPACKALPADVFEEEPPFSDLGHEEFIPREDIKRLLEDRICVSEIRRILERWGVHVSAPTLHRFIVSEFQMALTTATDSSGEGDRPTESDFSGKPGICHPTSPGTKC